MFPFLRKKKEVSKNIEYLKTDIHSHLIPGIDDGSKSMEESIALLKNFEKLGYTKIITTPHIMTKAFNNTKVSILENFSKLKKATQEAHLNIDIQVAAEYYVDEGFLSLLEKGELLPIDDEYILFETSYVNRPVDLESVIYNIIAAGYKPLLAHPERYQYIKNVEEEFNALKDQGALFQANLNSFVGFYGKQAQKNVEYLNENSMIDFLGSDVHHEKHMTSFSAVVHSDIYANIVSKNIILNNTI